MKYKFVKAYGPFRKGAVVEGIETLPGVMYVDNNSEKGLTYKISLYYQKLEQEGVIKKM